MHSMRFDETIPGVHSRRCNFKGASLWSYTGSARVLTAWLKTKLTEGQITAEQIAQFGVKKDATDVHLALIESPSVMISMAEASALLMDGYDYAHLVSVMDQEVNLALFDKGFEVNAFTIIALDLFIDAVFVNGKMVGGEDTVLSMIGRLSKNRVLVSYRKGDKISMRVIPGKLEGDVRYTIIKNNTVMAVEHGTGRVATLAINDLVDTIKTNDVPFWKLCTVPGVQIEDVSLQVGITPTVLLSLNIEGSRQLVPAIVYWDKSKALSIVLARRWAVALARRISPVIKVHSKTKILTTVGSCGGEYRLKVVPYGECFTEANNDAFVRLATDAVQGTIFLTVTET